MPNLLIEIYSEEIPSRFQKPLVKQFNNRLLEELQGLKIPYGNSKTFSSPQRISLVLEGLPWITEKQKVETRGPRIGAPEKAIKGFLKAKNKQMEDLTVKTVGNGEYYFLIENVPGAYVNILLQQVMSSVLGKMSLPKSMYWGTGRTKWIRPIKSLLGILYDHDKSEVVPFEFAGLTAGNTTFGHRFMGSDEIIIHSFESYRRELLNSLVIIDPEDRKKSILKTIDQELSHFPNLELVQDEDLLEEITGLVEWPVPLVGNINTEFQDLPDEVLQTSIKVHQKYLSVRNSVNGKITNFISVANIQTEDEGKTVIRGNQRVLASRLSDAQFFLHEDISKFPTNLTDVSNGLKNVRYSYGLGTQKNRVDRIKVLASKIASELSWDEEKTALAAQLSKFDLVTLMVKEFPELQGIIGRYYASKREVSPSICEAIEEHYLPVKTSDTVPTNPTSIAVGLADRINHLVGFFLRKDIPTGLGDPNALRRAVLGAIRLILENRISGLHLRDIISYSIDQHFNASPTTDEASRLILKTSRDEKRVVIDKVMDFILRRFTIYLGDKGKKPEEIEACTNVPNNDDLYETSRRIESLENILLTPPGKDLLHLNKRISKILSSDKAREIESPYPESSVEKIDVDLFVSAYEKSLFNNYEHTLKKISNINEGDYLSKLQEVSKLRKAVDDYFDNVMILVDDQKLCHNRLGLLGSIRGILAEDFDLQLISTH